MTSGARMPGVARAAVVVAALLGASVPAAAEHSRGSAAGSARAAESVVRLDSIVQSAIGQGATPGAAVAIGHSTGDVVIRTYGRTDWSKGSPEVTDSTLYDLASLTKVLAATPAAMLLVQQGRLDLDAPVSRYLSYWPKSGEKGRITVRDLLLHQAGFPAGEGLTGGTREDRVQSIAARPLAYAPGSRTIYSDISMVVLAGVVESITGQRLDEFVTHALYVPLEMRDTRFTPLHPLAASPFDLTRIAPTERVGDAHIQGFPQDPTARALDGVSGNAGLFSSVRDVARFAQLMLVGSQGFRTPVLADTTIELFTRRSRGAARALGWDAPTGQTFGTYFSDASFGHTGYTGTSIWIDPVRDVFVVLLTNRVDPTASNTRHIALRRAVNALVKDDFSGSATPSRPGLMAAAAALLKDLPFRAEEGSALLDDSAKASAWFAPGETGVLAGGPTLAGLSLALLMLAALALGLAQDPAVQRRARAMAAALFRADNA